MGLLRSLLALSVVIYHARPGSTLLVGGPNAVRCFYVISGFLISYVLVERRQYASVRSFYLSRYLRLYPIYVVVALLALAAALLMHQEHFLAVYRDSPPSAIAVLVLTNLFLIGQDWIMFLGVQHHALVPVANFNHSDVALYQGMLIHPAWTLGIELSFYAIAPFVLPRRKLIYALLLGSLLLRWYLVHLGLGTRDPWSYRFFPTELALFLAGALAQQWLLPWFAARDAAHRGIWSLAGTLALIALCALYYELSLPSHLAVFVLMGAFIALVPLAFLFQRRHEFDVKLGELSYPIYIVHWLVLSVTGHVLRRLGVLAPWVWILVVLLTTIAAAMVLNKLVGEPFERLRVRLRGAGSPDPRRRWRGSIPLAPVEAGRG
ncbi:MAG TPA: acyltransferase [Steroidobacteraceae bacterium]|nr:acyltransferase [Steroidobacteraceae bacterium]